MSEFQIDKTLPHYAIRVWLSHAKPGAAFDAEFAQQVGLPIGPAYSTDLNVIAKALNEKSCWWHLSHLEANVISTEPVKGAEGYLSNSARHDSRGAPVTYTQLAYDGAAFALCVAWIKAIFDLPDGYYVKASGLEQQEERNAAFEKLRRNTLKKMARKAAKTS